MIGTTLNQYRITASAGAGGMGEVFRARDTRLNRDVAIKRWPKDFVNDAPRATRRFVPFAINFNFKLKFTS
jgi:serine/threonine protein kinase